MVGTTKPLDDPGIAVNILVPNHGVENVDAREIGEVECGD